MQIEISVSNDPKVAKIPVEITDPLEFPGVGTVRLDKYERAELVVELDDPMRGVGVTTITRCYNVEMVQSKRVLRTSARTKNAKKDRDFYITLASRPALDLLITNRDAINMEIDTARNAVHAAVRQMDLDRDNVLRAEMRAKAQEMERLIPAGHLRVTVTKAGSLDGDEFYNYEVGGEQIPHSAITVHGWATAIRPGAFGAFDSICVASIAPDVLAQIRAEKATRAAERATKTAQSAAERVAKFQQARTSGQPVAITTYMAECNDRRLECSTDAITIYAMPDGTTTEERVHTY
jgi:hypothetical protein